MKRLPVLQAFVTRDHLLDDVFRAQKKAISFVRLLELCFHQFSAAKAIICFLVKFLAQSSKQFKSSIHHISIGQKPHDKTLMAFKRLMKEWECWDQKSPNRAMEEFGTFDEEQQLWKVQPQPLAEEKVDYLTWEAELRVSSGPFRGASFVYILNYPRDYPFKPPTLKVAFTGFPVAYQDIQEGWYVYMVPPRSTSGQRVAGAVTDAKEGGMTVQWKQQRLGKGCFGEGVDC